EIPVPAELDALPVHDQTPVHPGPQLAVAFSRGIQSHRLLDPDPLSGFDQTVPVAVPAPVVTILPRHSGVIDIVSDRHALSIPILLEKPAGGPAGGPVARSPAPA